MKLRNEAQEKYSKYSRFQVNISPYFIVCFPPSGVHSKPKTISRPRLYVLQEQEQKTKDTVEWSNVELERSVRAMEANVLQLEAGNHEADDSEVRSGGRYNTAAA